MVPYRTEAFIQATAVVGLIILIGISGCGSGNGAATTKLVPSPPIVRFTELWSEQFDGSRSNGLTELPATRNAGNQSEEAGYLLMGAQNGGRARVSVHLDIAGNPSGIVLRFAHYAPDGQIKPIGRTWPYTSNPTVIEIDPSSELSPGESEENPIDLVIAAGVDYDGDGRLGDTPSQKEVFAVSQWHVKLVSQLRYNVQILLLRPAFTDYQLFEPYASLFALSFLSPDRLQPVKGVRPGFDSFDGVAAKWQEILSQHYDTTDSTVFNPNREQKPLSHNVGVDYRSSAHGQVGTYRFPKSSEIATDIRASSTFHAQVLQPALEALAAKATDSPTTQTVARRVAAKFDDASEGDLYHSFGTAYYSIALTATVTCTASARQLNGIVLTGELFDIYDWNFDSPDGPFLLKDIFKQMASVQAGFGTLGNAGQVFTITVDLGSDLLELDGTQVGSPCGRQVDTPGPFTKVAEDGSDLLPDASNWACVRHNATGLLWEAHVRRGVNELGELIQHPCSWDASQSCTRYSNLNNGGIWDAPSVPPTVGALCGKTGWRLPTVEEAQALVNDPAYGNPPSLQARQTWRTWFGIDDAASEGWTSSLNSPSPVPPYDPLGAYYISFEFGFVSTSFRYSIDNSVRLVR